MKSNNIFTNLYQFFILNSKCISKEHHGTPIYFCSEQNCNKNYICSQCLTEDTEHFSQHVKYFIALDNKKNFFNYFDINFFDNNINDYEIKINDIKNLKNILSNKKINNSKNFYDYIKEYINNAFNEAIQNNFLNEKNIIEKYITKEKDKNNKINEFINNKIMEFIKKNEKKKINELIQKIKPYINYINYKEKEKIKFEKINLLLNEELKKLIEKCINIFIESDDEDNLDLNDIKDKSFYDGSINNISCIKNDKSIFAPEEFESKINININNFSKINNQNTIRYSSINDSFFKNIEENSEKNEKETNIKNNINKLPFNNFEFQKKEKLLLFQNDNEDIFKYISSKPTITAANNFEFYNSNNDLLNELEIKLNKIHNKDSLRNYLKRNINNIPNNNKSAINISINNFHRKNNSNNINNININNIYQSQREKKDNYNIINDGEKLNKKTKNNINRLNKLKEQIDKLIN